MKTTISEFKEKYPKLILRFERQTGKNAFWANKITKHFIYWLRQKIKYKTLICNDPNCPDYGKEFQNKKALIVHIDWHNPERRENHIKKMSGENNPNYGRCGDKNPSYGKFGKESFGYKDNVGVQTKHDRVRKIKPKPEVCDYCHKKYDKNGSSRLILSNIRKHQYTDNPDDYQYVHYGCHRKYDGEINNIFINKKYIDKLKSNKFKNVNVKNLLLH